MKTKKKTKTELLLERALVFRVPHELTVPVITMFCDYVADNGEEWAVTRFKSLKVDFLRCKAGLDIATPWVSKKNNYFKGPLGGLQRWAYMSDKNLDKAIQLLQVYSWFISSEVTSNQSSKFVDAVQTKIEYHRFFECYSDILLRATRILHPNKDWYSDPKPLVFAAVSSTKREPHACGKSYAEGELTLYCARSFLDGTATGRRLIQTYPNLFGGVLSGIASSVDGSQRIDHILEYPDVVGKIGLIQEPGYKLRAVANPARVYQQALKPLGNSLYDKLKSLPWDCTHDQEFPIITIQKHLSDGKTAHAVDLSNATDKFPFELQYRMLLQMYHRRDAIDLFADLSRSNWATTLTEDRKIAWTVGQPLGLYPSFASFALTHGTMLWALNGSKHNGDFYILGDDVIILNDGLFAKYSRFLINLGIPYAPSKSLSSNVITEFAGKIVTKNRVIPQLKWRKISDDSFIDLARSVGIQFRSLLRSRQRAVFDVICEIPDFLGGCGFNPHGKPLNERISMYYKTLSEPTLQSYLLSYNGRISKINHEPNSPCGDLGFRNMMGPSILSQTWHYARPVTDAFDQKALSLANEIPVTVLRRMFSLQDLQPIDQCFDQFPWKQSFGSVIYNAFPRERFSLDNTQGGMNTTLEVMERKLQGYL